MEFYDKVRGLVFVGGHNWTKQLLLLTYPSGENYFDQAKSYEGYTIVRVLGTVTNIDVAESN